MANKFVESILSEHKKLQYQRRLSSFLSNFAYRNKLQAKEIAGRINLSPQKYSYVKSSSKPYPKFINSLDYLTRLASLEEMNLSTFVQYLEGKDVSIEGDRERKVYDWQLALDAAFDAVQITLRKKFIDICNDSVANGKEKLESLLRLVALLSEEDLETIKSLEQTVKNLQKKK